MVINKNKIKAQELIYIFRQDDKQAKNLNGIQGIHVQSRE